MSTINGTTARIVTAKNGYSVAATADQRTDLNDLPICEMMYARRNEGRVCRATLAAVFAAMRDSSALIVLYADAKGEIAARCLWPTSVSLTASNDIICRAFCTLRREWRSFRLDRMITCHELTTPDDILADDEPHQDWEDSPQGRAVAAR